jgi:hypothetical protein
MSSFVRCSVCNRKWVSVGDIGAFSKSGFTCSDCLPIFIDKSTVNTKPDAHYARLAIEPWEYIRANKLDFFEGNVIKYISRWRHKNGLEDLLKAKVYIEELIRQQEASNE